MADRPDPVPDEVWGEAAKHFDDKQMAGPVLWVATTNLVQPAQRHDQAAGRRRLVKAGLASLCLFRAVSAVARSTERKRHMKTMTCKQLGGPCDLAIRRCHR